MEPATARRPFAGVDREAIEAPQEDHTDVRIRGLDPRPTEALLIEGIRPWVEEVRERIFGDREPPFDSMEDAREWLAGAREHTPPDSLPDRAREILDRIDALREELADLTGADVPASGWAWQAALCWRPDQERLARVLVEPRSDHGRLGRVVEDLMEGTGFSRRALYAHVLAGVRPSLPPATISRRRWTSKEHAPPEERKTDWDGEGRLPRYAESGHFVTSHLRIRLNIPLTRKQAWDLQKAIREAWPEAYKEDPESQLLREIVEGHPEASRLPKSGWSESFWTDIAAEWKRQGMEERSWRALMMRYRYLIGWPP